jgi:hypothetical protein
MRFSKAHRFALLVATITVATFAGCQKTSDRLPVSGTVTLDGTPLDDGTIRFSSLGGTAFSGGALIRDGQYVIEAEKGLPPGSYHIEITSPDNNSKPILYRTGPDDPGSLTQPERIPPEYNIESRQSVDISADRDNHFVFDITSKPAR